MAVRRNYRINLRNYGNPPAIMVSQYDENYDLVFEVFDGVVPATGLNAYTVKLVGRQPGEDPALKYEFTGTVSGTANNILSFTIDTTMTGKAGKGTAEIVILDTTNDVKFASFNLPVYVEKAAVPDDAIDADVERAQEIADEVAEIVDGATEGAEAWAVGQRGGVDVENTDPTYHNNAKYYAEYISGVTDQVATNTSDISDLKEDLNDIDDRVEALEQGSGGSGLTEAVKAALLQIAQKVAYIDADGQDYYDDLYDALYPPANLVSISAVYSGGAVPEGTSLNALKTDLTVTAHFDDQTTQTVTNYTLSGTLTEGTSTITVSYGGKTTTFTVTVTSGILYSWDLTDSLTDSVGGKLATTTATQDSTGLHFTSGSKYIEFPTVYAKDRTYEIDVISILRSSSAMQNYGRLFMVDADSATGTGGSGLILSGGKKGGDLFYMNGSWESRIIVDDTTDADGSYYDDSTVGFYVDSDGYISVYKDGTLLGTSAGALAASYDGSNIYFGSSANTDALFDANFSAFRVYAGNKYGGA